MNFAANCNAGRQAVTQRMIQMGVEIAFARKTVSTIFFMLVAAPEEAVVLLALVRVNLQRFVNRCVDDFERGVQG